MEKNKMDKRYVITRYLAGDPNNTHTAAKGYNAGNFIRNIISGDLFYTTKDGVHINVTGNDTVSTVKFTEQELSELQKQQARINIGLGNVDNVRLNDKIKFIKSASYAPPTGYAPGNLWYSYGANAVQICTGGDNFVPMSVTASKSTLFYMIVDNVLSLYKWDPSNFLTLVGERDTNILENLDSLTYDMNQIELASAYKPSLIVDKTLEYPGTVEYDSLNGAYFIKGVGTRFTELRNVPEYQAGQCYIAILDGGVWTQYKINTIEEYGYSDTLLSLDSALITPYTGNTYKFQRNLGMGNFEDITSYKKDLFRVNNFGGNAYKDTSNYIYANANFTPPFDNLYNLGSGGNRWKQVYSNTGAINTSDARLKSPVSPFTTDELNAAKQLAKEFGTYKFLSAIAEKGEESARKHIGMTVQKAIEIMQANNLDPFSYGFICYDAWDDEYEEFPATFKEAWTEEVKDENGEVVDTIEHPREEITPEVRVKVKQAGDIFSFRYEELLGFIARGFEERLSALENL